MKYLILLLTCFQLCSFGQNTPVKVYNRIDSITTTERVQEFVREVSGDTGYILRSDTPSKLWVKTDINNDGRTDLLVAGGHILDGWNTRDGPTRTFFTQILCLIDKGQEAFMIKRIRRGFDDKQMLPDIENIRGQTVIIYKYQESTWDIGANLKIDTLCFYSGDLIECNFHPQHYNIQKIGFKTEGGYGPFPIFYLRIDSNREAYYSPETDNTFDGKTMPRFPIADDQKNEMTGNYHAIIDTSSFNTIMKVLDYIDLENLNDDYGPHILDLPSYTLTITYNDGQKKRIHDNWMQGPYGLCRLYDLLFDLRKTQTWVKD